MLHQVFVQRVGDVQPTNERNGNHVTIAVIHQCHLALKITVVMFESLFGLHLDREEVIVLLELLLGSVLMIEDLHHLFEISE